MAKTYRQVREFGHALLEGTFMPTSTQPYEALEGMECAICEGPIESGALFTLALAPGFGRVRVPHCRACRPFNIPMDAIRERRNRGRS